MSSRDVDFHYIVPESSAFHFSNAYPFSYIIYALSVCRYTLYCNSTLIASSFLHTCSAYKTCMTFCMKIVFFMKVTSQAGRKCDVMMLLFILRQVQWVRESCFAGSKRTMSDDGMTLKPSACSIKSYDTESKQARKNYFICHSPPDVKMGLAASKNASPSDLFATMKKKEASFVSS